MIKKLLMSMVLLCIFVLDLAPLAVLAEDTDDTYTLIEPIAYSSETLDLSAEAAILVDVDTGTILYQQNADEILYPASTTKVLTAMIFLEYFTLDELIVLGDEVEEIPDDSSKAGHVSGETITAEHLLQGLLLVSGNDSANAIAVAVIQRIENDSTLSFTYCQSAFAELMNQKATALGATNSNFVNAHGYHDDNHYTTAHDMVLFCYAFTQNQTLMDIVGSDGYTGDGADGLFADDPSVVTQTYEFTNYNTLLNESSAYYYEDATGLKTGFTTPAGYCVTLSATDGDRDLLAVVFNAPSNEERWADSVALLDYGFEQYGWVNLTPTGTSYTEIGLVDQDPNDGTSVEVLYAEDQLFFLPSDYLAMLTVTEQWADDYLVTDDEGVSYLSAPIASGATVGEVTYQIGSTVLCTVAVVSSADIASNMGIFQLAVLSFFDVLFTAQGLAIVVVTLFMTLLAVRVSRVSHMRKRRAQKQKQLR